VLRQFVLQTITVSYKIYRTDYNRPASALIAHETIREVLQYLYCIIIETDNEKLCINKSPFVNTKHINNENV